MIRPEKFDAGPFYQFTAIDEATRYRVLKIYDHLSINGTAGGGASRRDGIRIVYWLA